MIVASTNALVRRCISLIGVMALAVLASNAAGQAVPSNVVIVLTDDMNLDDVAHMPNVQTLLVNEGVTFTNGFVVNSLCCPSRASILRGQYVHNHGIETASPPHGGFGLFRDFGHEESTLATWAQSAGYRTGLIGKYLNGYGRDNVDLEYIPPGWDEWYGALLVGNIYENYSLNENGVIVPYGTAEEEYSTDVFAGHALDFIGRHATDQRPFFLYVGTYAPHKPSSPAIRHRGLYDDVPMPVKPSFNEADVSDKPDWISGQDTLTDSEIAGMEDEWRDRMETLQAVDEMVADIVQALTDIDQLSNTYIIFTSDNGVSIGEHRLPSQSKANAYEEAIRVPMIVRGPRITAGSRVNTFVYNMDIAPTVADIADVTPPLNVDGQSFKAAAEGRKDVRRQMFLIEQLKPISRPTTDLPAYTAVRDERFKYVEYSQSGEIEFYDLEADPFELNNIAATAPPGMIQLYIDALEELRTCSGESCRPLR